MKQAKLTREQSPLAEGRELKCYDGADVTLYMYKSPLAEGRELKS